MRNTSNNKGFSLIELISAIAILSIVAISAFTLLMFSINSNNMILSGASASRDAELLNKRLELLFGDQYISIEEELCVIKLYEVQEDVYSPTGEELFYDGGTLTFGAESPELLQENLSSFSVSQVEGTSLIKISYTIGDHSFTKLFSVKDVLNFEYSLPQE